MGVICLLAGGLIGLLLFTSGDPPPSALPTGYAQQTSTSGSVPASSGQPPAIAGLEVADIRAAFDGLGLTCTSGPNEFPERAADNMISCTGTSSDGLANYDGHAEYRTESEIVTLIATSLPVAGSGGGGQPLLLAVGGLVDGSDERAAARAWLSAASQDPACSGTDCTASFGSIQFNLQTGDGGAVTVNLKPG